MDHICYGYTFEESTLEVRKIIKRLHGSKSKCYQQNQGKEMPPNILKWNHKVLIKEGWKDGWALNQELENILCTRDYKRTDTDSISMKLLQHIRKWTIIIHCDSCCHGRVWKGLWVERGVRDTLLEEMESKLRARKVSRRGRSRERRRAEASWYRVQLFWKTQSEGNRPVQQKY